MGAKVTARIQDFTDLQLARYSRQTRLDGFGLDGQRRLRQAHVVISRGGGVGGTVASYLARAGVGTFTIAHGGLVEAEHLNRWLLASDDDLGRPCARAFADSLAKVNPDVTVRCVGENISEDNVREICAGADLIVDGAPLFEERYLLNQQAMRLGVPLVSAAMYDTEGYVLTALPGRTPCLRCVYPSKPEYWTSVEVFGVVAPVCATVASVAAMEVVKVLTGFGEPLDSQVWFCDLATNITRLLNVTRRSDCPECGQL
jgi:molybdopterin/thiamine biosynthesis adenylyltransferase